ncbi:low temperature requirement protein A [Streptomyces diastatochromogenes]|nr:low temperature requirement protein A [Streptomyces diastatochromogenes]
MGLLAVAYLAGFAVMIGTATPVQAVALTVTDALTERFGLFIIIVLGETVTGVVDGLAHEPTNALTLAVGLVAVVVGFGAWWTYFDFAGHRRPRPTRASTVQWMLTHLPLTAAVAAMGAAMVGLVEHAHAGRTPAATAWCSPRRGRRALHDDGARGLLYVWRLERASTGHWPAPAWPWPPCAWASAPYARRPSPSASP